MNVNIEDVDLREFKRITCKWFGLGCDNPGPDPTPVPPGGSRPGLLFGYYGGGVVAQFADHCNLLHVGSWGLWTTAEGRADLTASILQQMHDARTAGINRVMITLDWCLYTQPGWDLLPRDTSVDYLIKFFDALRGAGVIGMVHCMYPVDEPDVQGISEQEVIIANQAVRDVSFHYPELKDKPLVVTYGVQGTPGISSYNWAGYDNYGTGVSGGTNFLSKLSAGQQMVLVPGGADPWREDPTVFNAFAQIEKRIALIMPFVWRDDAGVTSIHTNGMAPAYAAVGKPIKDANP